LNVSSKGIDGMVFLNLKDQLGELWFVRASVHYRQRSKQESAVILFLIVILHLVLIVVALNAKIKQREAAVTPAFKMIYLSHVKIPIPTELNIPVIEHPTVKASMALPEIVIEEKAQTALDITVEQPTSHYEFPNKKAGRYKDVFDPKLRKKLVELPIKTIPKPKIQYLGVGITLEDIGNGKCIYGNAFTGEGNIVKCGPDEGERMMLNVERALDDPLGLK
jgi:hypothetical protein